MNNKVQVLKRAINLDLSLKKDPEKLEKMCDLMENIFNTGAAEKAPDVRVLVHFDIWCDTPRKPDNVRAVFHSSKVYQGNSLNYVLLSGFPVRIQSTSSLMKEVSSIISVRQITSTPYHPMTNGMVERFNETLKQMLKRMCSDRPKDWDKYCLLIGKFQRRA
jgi:hypothetical protein